MKNPSVADPSVVQNTVEEVSLEPLQLIRSRVPGILPPSQEEGTIHPVRHSQAYQTIHDHTEPYTNQNIPNHTKPYQIVLTKRSQFILNLGQRIEDSLTPTEDTLTDLLVLINFVGPRQLLPTSCASLGSKSSCLE